MNMQFKFIIVLWIMFAQVCVPCVKGDLFNFPEKSLLNEQQQEEVRSFFLDVMLDASKSFIAYLQDPVFLKKINTSFNDPSALKTMLLERFFKSSRKDEDRKLVAKFARFAKNEEKFLFILCNGNDGLFNGVIRESIRRFTVKSLDRSSDKKAIIKEIFKVLWKGITNENLTCSIDTTFINEINDTINCTLSPDIIGSVYESFHSVPGDFCDKIATIVANFLCTEFNNAVDENCCCSCLKSTFGITKKVLKKVLPILPTLIHIALIITKEVI